MLRYLSDVYKGLVQNIPDEHRTDELDDVTAWLGAVVRQVDSSLIDEWERLLAPRRATSPTRCARRRPAERTIVDDERAFRVMVRNQMFDWAQRLARRQGYDALLDDADDREVWGSVESVVTAMAPYWAEFDEVLTGADARSGARFAFDRASGRTTQVLADPDDANEWHIVADVDLVASAEEARPVVRLREISRRT